MCPPIQWRSGLGALMILRAMLSGSSIDFYDGDKQRLVYPALESGLGKGSLGKRLMTGPLSVETGRSHTEKDTKVCPHVGPTTTGGA